MSNKNTAQLEHLVNNVVDTHKTPEELEGFLHEIRRRFYQSALDGELTNHLGYKKSQRDNNNNARNGYSKKTLKSSAGKLELEIPRDRQGSFEPELINKHQTRFTELDEKIVYFYAQGLSTEDISKQLEDIYGVDVSSSFISTVTNAVLEDVVAWQNRPLARLYPIIYLDCLVVKVKQDKRIINKAVYLALGVNTEGQKELLGMWLSENEGAKFWLGVLTELKNRGLEDVFIACVDGLTGFPEAIEAVFPKTQVQLCIVHMLRNSLKYVSWKDRKVLCKDLKAVYSASTVEAAELSLSAFSEKWDPQYPTISQSWLNNWERITPFFAYPADIRKAIYTTNAIESLNMTLRKVIKNKRSFPSNEKLLYLAINNIAKKWTMPIQHWKAAMNRFSIEFGDRVTV
jgi:transposase-like protein